MSLVLPSVQAQEDEQSRVCVYRQAANKTISDRLYTAVMWPSLSHTHTHTHTHTDQNSTFERSIANT